MLNLTTPRHSDGRVAELTRRVDKVSSVISLADEERQRLDKEVALAKGRIDYQDEVTGFMETLQTELHQKTVGRYETLLSAILRDVFPDERDKIVIDISTKRNLTAINFSIETEEGHREDVMDGRGGSIANVLSIGLRFISLSQTDLRQFMVLDEADCWLTPSRIPAVSRVIQMLSEQIGVQTLLISHHDPKAFEQHALMVTLLKQGDTVVAEANSQPDWAAGDRGIRGIYLNNVMSHENTFIPLSKGVTALIGDNDIGKSAVVSGLRALLYGEGTESLIRHGSDKAMVSLDLGEEGLLSYERFKKGAKKTRYALVKRDQRDPVHESIEAQVPDWLAALGFGLEEDLDIQLGHQKRPVFLLNEPDTRRASILSVGKEASWITAMRKQYKDDVKQDKTTIKQGEHRIQQLLPKLKLADRAELVEDSMEDLADKAATVQRSAQTLESQQGLLFSVEALNPIAKAKLVKVKPKPEFEAVDTLPQLIRSCEASQALATQSACGTPVMPPLEETVALTASLAALSRQQAGEKIADLPVLPLFEETRGIQSVGYEMMSVRRPLNQALRIQAEMTPISPLQIEDIGALGDVVTALEESYQDVSRLEKELKADQATKAAVDKALAELIEKNGGACPLCDKPWQQEHDHG